MLVCAPQAPGAGSVRKHRPTVPCNDHAPAGDIQSAQQAEDEGKGLRLRVKGAGARVDNDRGPSG
eukprot:13583411-Alexandrium_andersonii.AAC.1